ncbi:valine--tRNA ligase [Rhodobacteraceae bacterium HSP-20]|uniref:Valine--tRNA ligase n=1 Tax=Paragemmobacter amnigenus TaxID=2852097 RepID=A0ABS6JC01_9RHOB|nr:valine--tRNA ligase [Rhodobacter amnigenus]MBU9699915.1 valine--tRNA ligase [Rhodobacter amnigenus]MBV4391142.1 valine--tRNA ligase [Rhodobacter amnigenus]
MPMEKTFDAAGAEARISAKWIEEKAFRAGANARPGAESFCVMIPPPNVTGSLHMGHAFNNTLQDILTRWHRMKGHDTLWQPGTDHAGIATQMVTEREMAAKGEPGRREMGRDAFTLRVWEQKRKSRGTIIGQLQRLGCSCDWDREAFTMSGAPNAPEGEEGNFHDAVIRVFVDLYNKGFIYRGKRLVNWDPHFETAISDLEVENIEVDGHMWHFKYPLAGGATYRYVEKDAEGRVVVDEVRDYISIATTRPETMLGDGAVAVHPSDERYAAIVGKLCEIPVGPKAHRRLIPIIVDEYPDPTFGSGAVKITGAHDFNDYGVAKRGGIPCYRLMDTRARLRDDGVAYAEAAAVAQAVARGERVLSEAEADALNLVPDHLRGLDRMEARKRVVEEITGEGLAVMTRADDARLGKAAVKKDAEGADAPVPLVEAKKIMQPFGDRSKVVIEPMLTDQWFVDTVRIVQPALDAVRSGAVKIIPESGERTYYHWLDNIEPWCISRQLWWGHQIPVWYDDEGNHYCAATEAEAQAMAGGRRLERDPDVLDTWFSSGLWPIGTLGWPEETDALKRFFPTSVLITGQDILFFWVARMMMMQLAVVGEVPFRTVYLHGLVRDAKGKKMSKSLGNVIDPLEIIAEYGADALRFTNAAMASLGGVLKLDTARIAGYRNFGTKLWNACRFAEMNGVWEGHATQSAAPAATATANRWIIGETVRTLAEVDAALADYRFDQAADALYKFVWGKVCDWYVEFAKPLFDGDAAEETRKVMAWVLDRCMILLHPMMPFITEELWATTGTRAKMLVHTDWPEADQSLADAAADREMGWVTGLIDEIRSARAQMHVPVGLKIDLVATTLSEEARQAWARNEVLIKRLARVESLTEAASAPKGSVSIALEGAAFAMPLDGIIDIAEEKARLSKALEKLGKEIGGLKGRLGNPAFVASAPEEVVEEARANLEAREDEAGKLEAALKRLAEIG